MSESDSKPPQGQGEALGYSGFGAAGPGSGAGPKPPETPEAPDPFAPPPDAPVEAQAPWPDTGARPEPPGTPPPAYGSAAPEPSPIGYAPYGSAPGPDQPAGTPYPGAGGHAAGAPGAASPYGAPYGGAGGTPYGAPGAPFGGPPGGPSAMCAVHPETPAVGLCPRCGAYMCQWCQRINDFGEVFCATCMDRVGYGQPVPWDRRQELGIFQAWWQTFKESSMKPDDFFARASHGLSTEPPLLFAMICGWFGQVGDSIIRLAMNNQPITIPFLFLLGVPLSVVLSIYVGGGIAHLLAKAFGGTGTYAATCRNWGFCHSPGAIGVIPGLGMLVAGIWTIVLEVYAIKHAHRISGGKAAAVVLIPLGACCLCVFVVAIFFGAAMGAALGGRGGGGF